MKKKYIEPKLTVVNVCMDNVILTGSDPNGMLDPDSEVEAGGIGSRRCNDFGGDDY